MSDVEVVVDIPFRRDIGFDYEKCSVRTDDSRLGQ